MSKPETFTAPQAVRPAWVRLRDVQHWFGVSKTTVYRAAAAGDVTIYRRCGSRVNADEMDAWLRGRA